MGRHERRLKKKLFTQQLKTAKYTNDWIDQTPEWYARRMQSGLSRGNLIKFAHNEIYSVQIYQRESDVDKIIRYILIGIRRHDEKPDYDYKTIMKIKEHFYPEHYAFMVYPRQSEEIDQANITWIWVVSHPQYNLDTDLKDFIR